MANHVQIETFTTSGTFTAKVTGVHTFKSIGTGGGGTVNTGAGGGGAYAQKSISMTSGDTATITVETGASDTDGGDTTVTISAVVQCKAVGGKSGSNGGTGGASGDCIGDVAYSGGDGVIGGSTRSGGGGAGTTESGSGATGGNYFGGVSSQPYYKRSYGSGGGSLTAAGDSGTSGVCFVSYNKSYAGFPVITNRAYTRFVGSSNVINLPSGDIGDLILVLIASDSNSTSELTYTTTRWTKVEQANSGTETVRGLLVYKVATGSDSLTLGISSPKYGTAIALRIKNFIETDYIGVASAGGDSTNADSPNLDMTDENKYLWISAVMRDLSTNSENKVSSQPTNYLDFEYLTPSTVTAGADIAISTRHLTATSENPGAFTSDSEQWAAFTIAIKPYPETTIPQTIIS